MTKSVRSYLRWFRKENMVNGIVEYPQLKIDLGKIKVNAQAVINLCHEKNVDVCGVVKVVDGDEKIAKVLIEQGAKQVGISRIYQAIELKNNGIKSDVILMRAPSLSEIESVIDFVDISLNSEIETIKKLNDCAIAKNKIHKVVLMLEMGDLREGVYEEQDYLDYCKYIDHDLKGIHLMGVGMNLGCYGSIQPTQDKYTQLSEKVEAIEKHIGRQLEMISGLSSNSLPNIANGLDLGRVNHARTGEGILFNQDNKDLYGFEIPNTFNDAFHLEVEIIELKEKPSHPIGEIGYDAFRNKQTYEDKGNHLRAIVNTGKLDYGFDLGLLHPVDENIKILGASSDHTILEINTNDYKVFDKLSFMLNYGAVGFLSPQRSIKKVYTT